MTTDSAAHVQSSASKTAVPQSSIPITQPANRSVTLPPSNEAARPAILRQWRTERPQPATKASILNVRRLTRHATNVPILNEALCNRLGDDDDLTSSSSSDDDEDLLLQKGHHRRRRPRNSTGHENQGSYRKFSLGNDDFKTKGKVSKKDGRLNISINETNNRGYLAKALGASFLKHLGPSSSEDTTSPSPSHTDQYTSSEASSEATIPSDIPRPTLNIVVMVIGSRGDIQPFLKLGKQLKEFGHRIRIATHPAFKDFVQNDSGLEFFSVGGDPAELMAFMVKNPGMIPTMETLKKGEIGRRRDQMAEMFEGLWRACINATDDEKDLSNLKMMGEKAPFIADAIIANPPSFAHIHCAERLGIPLHIMFTFPWSPTTSFPHPLANVKKSNIDPRYTNFMSYPLVEMMTWQGLGDLVNNFRMKTLGLEPVSTLWAPGQLYRLKVPHTYLWSPGLVPKPKDWGPEIDIAGFVFLDLASSFEPPEALVRFLDAGEPPIYIGFGSIVVDEPEKFTKMIFEAVEKAGVRALVSKGWGGLGEGNVPKNVYMLENTPHDWLFPKVSAVVHHGGAGTTAIGLKCGKPTMIVPFFGDQQFWGSMIREAGAGAEPVPHKKLTAKKLAEGIKQCLTDEARQGAEKIAKAIEAEGDGSKNAVTSFHRSLVLRGHRSMRCSILEDRVAVWTLKNTSLRLSALAAELLVERNEITWRQLRLIRHNEWNDFEGPGEPLTGGAAAVMSSLTDIAGGVGSVPFRMAKSSRRRNRREERRRRKFEEVTRRSIRTSAGNDSTEKGDVNQENDNSKNYTSHHDWAKINRNIENTPDSKTENIPSSMAPGTHGEKATHGPDMGKHTTSGEPISTNSEYVHGDLESEFSEVPNDTVAEEMAQDVGSGVGKSVGAITKAPMELSLAIAQGFHNAPRLYGDDTVRRPTRITGMKSGLRAAGEGFIFGIYDGCTGLALHPYRGARDNGPVGFVKGVGMGLTGFVLKDLAAVFGLFGYTFKGMDKQLSRGRQPTNFIRRARILEGQRDLHELEETEKRRVIEKTYHGWSVVQKVWDVMEENHRQGLRGKIHIMKERKTWRSNGVFENVEMAERALEAVQKGESLDTVFAQQREELKLAQKPRKNVVSDMEEGKGGQDNNERAGQKVGKPRLSGKEIPIISG